VTHRKENGTHNEVSVEKSARCTALRTHTTTWNTCYHNTAKLI